MAKTNAFDRHTEYYDAWFTTHQSLYEAELQGLRTFIPESAYGVEIGVGTGRFAQPLGVNIGIEPSSSMAQVAKGRGVTIVNGVSEKLPFRDNTFDYALMVTCICFFDNVTQAFCEAERVLNSGGKIIVAFIDSQSDLGRSYNQKKKQSLFYKDARFLSNSEVQEIMAVAGFSNIKYQQIIIDDLSDTLRSIVVKEGYGEGGVVIACGRKDG